MDDFKYKNGELFGEEVSLTSLVSDYGTPLYVYSTSTLKGHYERFEAAFAALNPTICFSVKSCHNLSILKLLSQWGASFDVVSGDCVNGHPCRLGNRPTVTVEAGRVVLKP